MLTCINFFQKVTYVCDYMTLDGQYKKKFHNMAKLWQIYSMYDASDIIFCCVQPFFVLF